jgi:DNA-binding transcriptional regulator GbsR (MarR family)
MSTKNFKCKIEEVPVLGEFIVNSVEKDIDDFNNYSSLFTADYLVPIKAKIEVCKELAKSSIVSKELKATTQKLYDDANNLRGKLNALEGYLKLGADSLDIAVKDFDLKNLRLAISKHNIEGVIATAKTVLVAVKRNLPVLNARGLRQELIDEIETQLEEINSLNEKQNDLISQRNRLTDENISKFNDLWESLQPILTVAKAIYSADKVKLKDYTVSQLLRRMNANKK